MPEGRRFKYIVSVYFFAITHTLSSYLKAILSRDRRTYGVAPGTVAIALANTTVGEDEPLIQQRIEDLIETPGGATTFQPPPHVLDS
jgi:hypothetical protein